MNDNANMLAEKMMEELVAQLQSSHPSLREIPTFSSLPLISETMNHRNVGNAAIANGDYQKAYHEYSKGLIVNPNDPILWCNRAYALLKLGHPELAIVDAGRAINTIDQLHVDERNKFGLIMPTFGKERKDDLGYEERLIQLKLKAKLRECQAYEKLNLLLHTQKSCVELLKWKEEYAEDNIPFQWWPEVTRLQIDSKKKYEEEYAKFGDEYKERIEKHGEWVFRGSYPWDRRQIHRVDDEIFQKLQKKIEDISSSQVNLVKDTFEELGNEPHYGLRAASDISANTVIFEETPFLCVNSKAKTRCDYCNKELKTFKYPCPRSDCTEFFCDNKCYKQAYDLYHRLICGKDFTDITEVVKDEETTSSLYHLFIIKLFAIGVLRNICPLDIEEIQHLRRWEHENSSFTAISIEIYQKIMQILGIPQSDFNFDFWVYISCLSAIKSNVRTGTILTDSVSLYPLTSLVNHNCNPNAKLYIESDGSDASSFTKIERNPQNYELFINPSAFLDRNAMPKAEFNTAELKTKEEIKKGNMITINYVNFPELDDEERCRMLRNMCGIKCKCSKCSVQVGNV
ncbi:12624_t:CDS:2 [Ambispora leptoticha]|uniref:12624_t:CDS:1 n=1 Tax=Ambispora leptoticha TaxID=144679 RepID=A0A9N9DHI9_9GLOM|nr:12624_t:CDS:2 [Ambispora leptoticha]